MTARDMPPADPSRTGLPAYVKGWCCKASEGTLQCGFADVGYLLAARVRSFRPAAVPPRLWQRHMRTLEEHVEARNQAGVQRWFHTHYPPLMHLIPKRRHREFAQGVIQRATEPATGTGPCKWGSLRDSGPR
jgi:hypothetical protein